jgi:hypothetical protein
MNDAASLLFFLAMGLALAGLAVGPALGPSISSSLMYFLYGVSAGLLLAALVIFYLDLK